MLYITNQLRNKNAHKHTFMDLMYTPLQMKLKTNVLIVYSLPYLRIKRAESLFFSAIVFPIDKVNEIKEMIPKNIFEKFSAAMNFLSLIVILSP